MEQNLSALVFHIGVELVQTEQAFVIGASLTKLKRNLSKLEQIFSD